MKSIAILPLRKGSKGIPGKNKKKILGRPLYQWVLGEAIFSSLDEIYVFTDDEEILDFLPQEYSWTSRVKAFKRSEESASDTASTESAMIELAGALQNDFDIICLLQATSPLTRSRDINNCLNKVIADGYNSALSVVETKRFIWSKDGKPLNYDFLKRPRRQDFDGLLMENGAVYASTKDAFIDSKNRLSGNIGVSYMPEESLYEIDEPHDFVVVGDLIESVLRKNKKQLGKIKAMVFDIDGVMTNGTVLTGNREEIAKPFSLRDGMGLSFLPQEQISPIVMTSENSPIVHARMKKLGIKEYHPGTKDKFSRLQFLLDNMGLDKSEVAYVGDDVNDLSNMVSVGWSFCPANAVPVVKSKADVVLQSNGGDLAVREAIEFVIQYNNRFV